MEISELRSIIAEITSAEDCSAEFYFLFGDASSPYVRAVDIDSSTQDDLASMFQRSVNDSLEHPDAQVISISTADSRANAIYEYDLDEEPAVLGALASVIARDDHERFNSNHEELRGLRAILVLVGNHEAQFAIYKHQYPVSFLRPGSWFGLMPDSESRFSKLDSDIIKVNGSFEFLTVDGTHYIFKLSTLERFFGFHEAIRNSAKEGLAAIEASDLVQDTSVLEERLDDISFARKLVRCSSHSPVLGSIPAGDVIAFTQQHPGLAGRFSYNDDSTQISLSTISSQNLFLKLLNDDYLQSQLTKTYYDSIAKDII